MADEIQGQDQFESDIQFIRTTDKVLGDPPGTQGRLVGPINVVLQKIVNSLVYLQNRISGISVDVPNATTTVRGIAEIATKTEAETGTDTTRITPPVRVFDILKSALAQATESRRGTMEVATEGEADAGTDDRKAITALLLKRATKDFRTAAQIQASINAAVLSKNKPTWTTIPLQRAVDGNAFKLDLWTHLSGFAPISLTASGLPTGFTLNTDGTITGSSVRAGSHSVTITARNIHGSSQATFTLAIIVNIPVWDSSPVQNGDRVGNQAQTFDLNDYVTGENVTFTFSDGTTTKNFGNSNRNRASISGSTLRLQSTDTLGTLVSRSMTIRARNSAGFSDRTFSIVFVR